MRSLAKNYFLNMGYQVLIVLLPLITAPYLARVLGAERVGEYSFAQSVISYFALFAVMGTALYGQRRIAVCYAKDENRKQVFAELVLLRLIGVAAAMGVYFACIFPFAENRVLYLVASIEILAVAFDISWFYQGIEQFQNITLCSGLSKLLGVVGVFALVKTRADLELYVALYCGAILVGNAAQWLFLKPYLRGQGLERLQPWQHVRPALSLFISQFAIQAYTVLDKTMIGLITHSDAENGYYDQAQKLIRALTAVVTSIGTVMASRISILWHSDKTENKRQVQEMLLFSFRLIFALSLPLTAGTVIISSRFVPIFFGDGYAPVVGLIQILVVILPIIGCSNIIGMQLFVPSGREHLLTRSVLIGAGVNAVLNMVIIPLWGAVGAAVASAIAELAVTATQMYLARKELPLLKVARLLGRYLLLTGIVCVPGLLVSCVAGMGIGAMVLIFLVCVVTYICVLVAVRDPILGFFLGKNQLDTIQEKRK